MQSCVPTVLGESRRIDDGVRREKEYYGARRKGIVR
jgi:hypothetical protein